VSISLAIARGNETYQYLNRSQTGGGRSFMPRGAFGQGVGQGPAWFLRMDTNGDGDLTRREFLGSDEQFNQLDKSGDGAISTLEIAETEKK
jgi:hypothetical protein